MYDPVRRRLDGKIGNDPKQLTLKEGPAFADECAKLIVSVQSAPEGYGPIGDKLRLPR
jgi:hypothetical protein